MRGKEEKNGRRKEEKKKRKGEKNGDQIANKRSPYASFSSAQSPFLDQSEICYLE